MAEAWEWTEQDLLSLIANQVKENIQLDYKACPALQKTDYYRSEISKDVSAFANSAGGTIVYGIKEENNLPASLDIGYDPAEITREWLEQVINSRIQQRIDGVHINQVELTTTSPGRVAYVVWIPQSMRAAHQASDKRYYKRFNFESIAMEDYEIRDVGRRQSSPLLRLHLNSEQLPLNQQDRATLAARLGFTVYIVNYSSTPAEYARVRIAIPDTMHAGGWSSEIIPDHTTIIYNARQVSARLLTVQHSISNKMPIWASVPWRVGIFAIAVSLQLSHSIILWDIDSPGMATQSGLISVGHNAIQGVYVDARPGSADSAIFMPEVFDLVTFP